MLNCETLDPLVTPYVDGQLGDAERQSVDRHLRACPSCYSRVVAERAVHTLIAARKRELGSSCAPVSLHSACARLASSLTATTSGPSTKHPGPGTEYQAPGTALRRLAPFAVAASLVGIVGGAFLYQLTASSARVMAAELAADHVKCFAMNGVLHTHEDVAAVESSMLSYFDWAMRLPANASQAGLELVGSRPCLYGQGKIAHIMYRHNGSPVSLFMLPKTERAQEMIHVLGHNAAIWCANDRTFVLVTREPDEEVQRMATLVQASLR